MDWKDLIANWLLTNGLRILLITGSSFALYFVLKKVIAKVVTITVTPGENEEITEEQQRENTLIQIFTLALKITLTLIAGLMIATEFGLKIAPLLASAGVVGLALGFGGQYLIKDIISGFFIILENQYRINDVVKIAELSGLVEKITLRMTRLRDIDGNVHHIPHGEIKTVTNYSKSFARANIDVGVAYGTDIEKVASIVNQTGNELANDENWKDKIITPPQFLRVIELGESSVKIKILGETKPLQQWAVGGEMLHRIYVAFAKNNIEIPFPQRVLHIINKDKNE